MWRAGVVDQTALKTDGGGVHRGRRRSDQDNAKQDHQAIKTVEVHVVRSFLISRLSGDASRRKLT
jgi:hypothetical protein